MTIEKLVSEDGTVWYFYNIESVIFEEEPIETGITIEFDLGGFVADSNY